MIGLLCGHLGLGLLCDEKAAVTYLFDTAPPSQADYSGKLFTFTFKL